jgi:hypothetical protein
VSDLVEIQQFYGLRAVFGVVSAFCETVLVNHVQIYRSPSMGVNLLVILFAGAGMFVASTGTNFIPICVWLSL